jgi:hypothetical protein
MKIRSEALLKAERLYRDCKAMGTLSEPNTVKVTYNPRKSHQRKSVYKKFKEPDND